MTVRLSTLYQDLLGGSYDCVDRIVLNAYFRMGHDPGGFRVWWRELTGSDETLEKAYLMRLAGRFSRRIRGYAKAHDIPVIDCSAGQRKHELAEEYLAKTTVTQGLFLVLVGRAQAPVWDVNVKHRAPGNRAIEPGLRALDLHLSVLCPRLRRAETQRVSLSVLQLSDRIQSQPGLPGGRASRPGVSGLDRPQPRTIGSDVHQNDPGIPSPPEISPPRQAIGRMGSERRETCL